MLITTPTVFSSVAERFIEVRTIFLSDLRENKRKVIFLA